MALSGELAAPFDSNFDPAQAGGVDDDVDGVAEAVSGGGVGDLERQHGPEAGHLRGGGAVPRVTGKAGVANAADGRVLVEASATRACVLCSVRRASPFNG